VRVQLARQRVHAAFVTRIEALSGQDILACYQCGKCSAGCPAVWQMDLLPSQVIRYIQLGFEDEVLRSEAYWICASCLACNARCPKGIRIAEVMEALRQLRLRQSEDRLVVSRLSDSEREDVPPIALISSLRKYTA